VGLAIAGNGQGGEQELRVALQLDPNDEDAKKALPQSANLPPALKKLGRQEKWSPMIADSVPHSVGARGCGILSQFVVSATLWFGLL
jgi:hypothetical protein